MLRHDKIELRVTGWRFEGSVIAVNDALRSLSRIHEIGDTGYQPIFRRFSEDVGRGNVEIRLITHSRRTHPLFGGSIRVTSNAISRSQGSGTFDIELNLNLNPTRFLNYQRITRAESDELQQFQISGEQLFNRTNRVIDGLSYRQREKSLDNSDNLIFGPWENIANSGQWPRLVNDYLSAVLYQIEHEFRHAASGISNLQFNVGSMDYNFRNVEAYIDLAMPDEMNSINFTERFQAALQSYGRRLRINDFEVQGIERTEALSRQFRIGLGVGRELAIYAKTDKRVRFEIRLDLTACQEILHPPNSRRSHTTRSRRILHNWISYRVPDESARLLNNFWAHLRRSTEVSNINTPAYLLLGQISEICGSYTRIILTSLVHANGIAISPNSRSLRRVIRQLTERGILERVGNSTTNFCLTRRYQRAVEGLASLGDVP